METLVPRDERKTHNFAMDGEQVTAFFGRELYRRLISSKPFKRLSDVRFLGAIDYFIHPNGDRLHQRRHTRAEHALGVAQLALHYARERKLEPHAEMVLVSAALLHDIGHAPLSHSMEPIFKSSFGIGHREAGRRIVIGGSSFSDEIPQILTRFSINPHDVVATFAGEPDMPHSSIFSHPINIDTVEAISRCETYIHETPAATPPALILDALSSATSAHRRLDAFWQLKDAVYRTLIGGPVGIFADYISIHYMRTHIEKFEAADVYLSERQLKIRHADLFAFLSAARKGLLQSKLDRSLNELIETFPAEVPFTRRSFWIDSQAEPGSVRRYRETKTPASISRRSLCELASAQVMHAAEMDRLL